MKALPAQRRELQRDLRTLIKKVGPAFGDLYYEKDLNWNQIQELARKNSAAIFKVASSGAFDPFEVDAVKIEAITEEDPDSKKEQ